MHPLEIALWIAVAVIAYTLVAYPILSVLLAAIIRKKVDKRPITPSVSFIIAAYNEENAIAEKIEQTVALDYPRDRLEIIVASDGSTDRTDEIVRSFADRGVKLYRCEGRKGKAHTLNQAVANAATGEVIVFSDATGVFNPQAIRELVANLNDPEVGCVTGRVAYRYGRDVASRGFKGYQRFAVAVRRAETRFGSQTSVSGSIHAIRRDLYRPCDPAYSLDVIDALHTVVQGYRVVYENDAVSWEDSRSSVSDEFRCRVRMGVRGATMTPYIVGQLLRHARLRYAFQMFSHKLLRWYLWLPLLAALATNAMIARHNAWYGYLFAFQILSYATGVVGLVASRFRVSIPFVALLSLFLIGNAGMCIGVVKALFGRRMAGWQPVR